MALSPSVNPQISMMIHCRLLSTLSANISSHFPLHHFPSALSFKDNQHKASNQHQVIHLFTFIMATCSACKSPNFYLTCKNCGYDITHPPSKLRPRSDAAWQSPPPKTRLPVRANSAPSIGCFSVLKRKFSRAPK